MGFIFSYGCAGLAPGFSGCCEQGLFFPAAPRLLGVVPSLPLSTGSGARGLSSCGLEALERVASAAVAWRLWGTWTPPRPGIKRLS